MPAASVLFSADPLLPATSAARATPRTIARRATETSRASPHARGRGPGPGPGAGITPGQADRAASVLLSADPLFSTTHVDVPGPAGRCPSKRETTVPAAATTNAATPPKE